MYLQGVPGFFPRILTHFHKSKCKRQTAGGVQGKEVDLIKRRAHEACIYKAYRFLCCDMTIQCNVCNTIGLMSFNYDCSFNLI